MEREKGIEWEGQRERENGEKEKAVFVHTRGVISRGHQRDHVSLSGVIVYHDAYYYTVTVHLLLITTTHFSVLRKEQKTC